MDGVGRRQASCKCHDMGCDCNSALTGIGRDGVRTPFPRIILALKRSVLYFPFPAEVLILVSNRHVEAGKKTYKFSLFSMITHSLLLFAELPFIATFIAGAIAGISEILTFYPLGVFLA